jgi:NAD(P)-dependent dehydrogenase (short-subunit alcohol dehydrogenase family)
MSPPEPTAESAASSREDFAGRVAIVTGGTRGIGFAVAEELLDRGAAVVVCSRDGATLDDATDNLERAHPECVAGYQCDVGKQEDVESLIDVALGRFGRLDVLINNAATNPYFGPLIDADISAWDKTFEVNLRGTFVAIKTAVDRWMREHGGCVVNVASVGGLRPGREVGIYNVTKAGVVMLTRQLAYELGPLGIRVNGVAPGLIRTQFSEALWGEEGRLHRVVATNPMRRIGEAHEVSSTIVFLASSAAGYINGEVIVIDGGGGEFS